MDETWTTRRSRSRLVETPQVRLQLRIDRHGRFARFLRGSQPQVEFGKLETRFVIEPRELRQRRLLGGLRGLETIFQLLELGQRVGQRNRPSPNGMRASRRALSQESSTPMRSSKPPRDARDCGAFRDFARSIVTKRSPARGFRDAPERDFAHISRARKSRRRPAQRNSLISWRTALSKHLCWQIESLRADESGAETW